MSGRWQVLQAVDDEAHAQFSGGVQAVDHRPRVVRAPIDPHAGERPPRPRASVHGLVWRAERCEPGLDLGGVVEERRAVEVEGILFGDGPLGGGGRPGADDLPRHLRAQAGVFVERDAVRRILGRRRDGVGVGGSSIGGAARQAASSKSPPVRRVPPSENQMGPVRVPERYLGTGAPSTSAL